MEQEKISVLKDLSGKTSEEKLQLVNQWKEEGLISQKFADELTKKVTIRKAAKEKHLAAIKEAQKDNHAFDALFKINSSREQKKEALQKLQSVLRMKRKAYLTDRYFNAALSNSERKALACTFLLDYKYYPIQIGDILIEILKYPIKEIKMDGNAYLEKQLSEGYFDIPMWVKMLNRQYVAKRQWQQMDKYMAKFMEFSNGDVILPHVQYQWEERNDRGALLILFQMMNWDEIKKIRENCHKSGTEFVLSSLVPQFAQRGDPNAKKLLELKK